MLISISFVSAENHPDLLARTVLLFDGLAIHILALTTIRPERFRKCA